MQTSPALSPEQLARYNASRSLKNLEHFCLAPFNNMYFNTYGQASPCWQTLHGAPRYPEHSIREIWFGERFSEMRRNMAALHLSKTCGVCERKVIDGLFESTLAQHYDSSVRLAEYPRMMEFELSNLCNLECIMCKGFLSSTIRRNRDLLPPLESPYDDEFVRQLDEFIPHLTEARFNGGEPFLQAVCWSIWERMVALNNQDLLIAVATNATSVPNKVRRLFEKGRFRFNMSLDSVRKDNYERIRKGAHFETTLENMRYLGDYCKDRNTVCCLMVNPMRVNWQELPEFVELASENDLILQFNTVWRPFHLALWTMESKELRTIHEVLSRASFSEKSRRGRLFEKNHLLFQNFLENELKTWCKNQEKREVEGKDYKTRQGKLTGSKAVFLQKLETALGKNMPRKLEHQAALLGDRVSRNLSADEYYDILASEPIEGLVANLEAKSLEEMTEWVYHRHGYY